MQRKLLFGAIWGILLSTIFLFIIIFLSHEVALAQGFGQFAHNLESDSSQTQTIKKTNVDFIQLSFEEKLFISVAIDSLQSEEQYKKQRLEQLVSYIKQNAERGLVVVEVENFKDFLKSFSGEIEQTSSMNLNVDLLFNKAPRGIVLYKSASPRVQRQIDRFLLTQAQLRADFFNNLRLKNNFSDLQFVRLFETLSALLLGSFQSSQSSDPNFVNSNISLLFRSGLEKTVEQLLGIITFKIESEMSSIRSSAHDYIRKELQKSEDPLFGYVMSEVLSDYLTGMSAETEKQILFSALNFNGDLGENDKLELFVENGGPIIKKFLQIMARQKGLSGPVVKIFKKLEKANKPASSFETQKLFDREKKYFKFVSFELKPLGVGTMAQIHRAKVVVNDQIQNVVVRFLKPGIGKRILEDREILARAARNLDQDPHYLSLGGPKLSPLVEDVVSSVVAEMDQALTRVHQQEAFNVYNDQTKVYSEPNYKNLIRFKVPKTLRSPRDSEFFIQQMVFGSGLDEASAISTTVWGDLMPQMKMKIIEALAEVWLNEAFYKSGFYHADLHAGNILVHILDDSIDVNLLDYGMVGRIDQNLQGLLVQLGAALEINKTELIAECLLNLAQENINRITLVDLTKQIHQRFNLGSDPRKKLRLNEVAALALDLGLRLPQEFINLNRGIGFLNKMLLDSGSTLTIETLSKKQAVFFPKKMTSLLLSSRLNSKLTLKDLIVLGWSQYLEKKDFLGAGLVSTSNLNSSLEKTLKTSFVESQNAPPLCRAIL